MLEKEEMVLLGDVASEGLTIHALRDASIPIHILAALREHCELRGKENVMLRQLC